MSKSALPFWLYPFSRSISRSTSFNLIDKTNKHHGLHNRRHMHAKPDYVPLLHAELNEAYRIHSQDCETISWLIMQPLYDPQDSTPV